MRLIHVCALDSLHRKPRINSQLVAQQVAQQYPMPPPPKKERRERSERTEKERPDGEGERANGEGRPEGERREGEHAIGEGRPECELPEGERRKGERGNGEGHPESERPESERPESVRPESVRPEGDTPEKDKSDREQPIKDKPDREKDIVPAITKKPNSKKTRSVEMSNFPLSESCPLCWFCPHLLCMLFSSRPKSDNHQSPPSDKHSIQSGKSATKTNKNSHISRCVAAFLTEHTLSHLWLLSNSV